MCEMCDYAATSDDFACEEGGTVHPYDDSCDRCGANLCSVHSEVMQPYDESMEPTRCFWCASGLR